VLDAENKTMEADEVTLSRELRTLCDESGKEIDPTKSAEVIRLLGRSYRLRSPDKISLIRSAILFNAAIARAPENVGEIKEDLNEICAHVLHLAGAENKTADLLKQSRKMLREVKEMREVAEGVANSISQIPEDIYEDDYLKEIDEYCSTAEQTQDYIYQKCVGIMDKIMQFAVELMGKKPSKYALLGMGSLVTKEITPYSDFESIIVLEDGIQYQPNYENKLEYFRWVATIFQLILVSFGETVIYDAAIPSLNHPENKEQNWFFDAFTPCGISPDGFYPHASHNPLGRQDFTYDKPWKTELIKPVSEMLKYLDEDEDRRNGYHLADILTKYCFVSGDRDLFDHFDSSVKKRLLGKGPSANFVQLMKSDQQRFGLTKGVWCLQFAAQFDVKRVVYRTITMSVSMLGQIYDVGWASSFEIVDKLHNLLTRDLQQKIKYAVAIACVMRLKNYLKHKGQVDFIESGHYDNEEFLSTLVEELGSRGACDFIITALCLQEIVVKAFEQKFSPASSEPAHLLDSSHLYRTWMLINRISGKSPTLKDVVNQSDTVIRMMNYDFASQAVIFSHQELMDYSVMQAIMMASLEQFMLSLKYCCKALLLDMTPPYYVRIQIHSILKNICYFYFQDDEEINRLMEETRCQNFCQFVSPHFEEMSLNNSKRSVEGKISQNERVKQKMLPERKLLLRQNTKMILDRLRTSNFAITDPLALLDLSIKTLNKQREASGKKPLHDCRELLEWTYEKELGNDGSKIPSDKEECSAHSSSLQSHADDEHDDDLKTDEYMRMYNQAAASMGMGVMMKDEDHDKIKKWRSSLIGILKPALQVLTLDMAKHLRELKQLEDDGNPGAEPSRSSADDEMKSLLSYGLSLLKSDVRGLEVNPSVLDNKNIKKSSIDPNETTLFVEDDLD